MVIGVVLMATVGILLIALAPILAIVGAIRLARPNSPWARRRYPKRPKKLARARRREERLDAHTLAWRDAFFDLIAGKPHLPSLPPAGAEQAEGPAAAAKPGDDRGGAAAADATVAAAPEGGES